MDLSTAEPGAVLTGNVGGYAGINQADGQNPNFRFSNANFGKHAERKLYYHAGTNQGMSGSPVWVNYLGHDIAVGIHNKHEDVKGDGNRGARLGLEAILNILKWTGADAGLLNKAIRVHEPKTNAATMAKDPGIFLQCGRKSTKPGAVEALCYAWSGPTRDPGLTSFDIVPGQILPTYAGTKGNDLYLMKTAGDGPSQFPRFLSDPKLSPKQVVYSDQPKFESLVKLVQQPASKSFTPGAPFKILIPANHDEGGRQLADFKLTLWTEDIPPPTDLFGLERARLGLMVRMGRYRSKPAPQEYESFILA